MKNPYVKPILFVMSLFGSLMIVAKSLAFSLVEVVILVALISILIIGGDGVDQKQDIEGTLTSCSGEALPFTGVQHVAIGGNKENKVILHFNIKGKGVSADRGDGFLFKANDHFKLNVPSVEDVLLDDLAMSLQSHDRIIFKGRRASEKLFFKIALRFTNQDGQTALVIDQVKLRGGCL